MKEFQDKLIQIIIPVFENAIEERKNFYKENPKPDKEKVSDLIQTCSLKNGAISFTSGIIPGPYALLAIIPELKLTLENQIAMIFDIGVANGKEDLMSKEMVLTLAMRSGVGTAGISAIARQGEKFLITKASVKAFKEIAKSLGIKLTSKIIKSSVTRFVPVLGGLAIGVWVKYTTSELGESSDFILKKDLEIQETDALEINEQDAEEKIEVLENKVIVLMNLMKIDGNSMEKEKDYISQIIENSDLSFYTKAKFKVDLNLSSLSEVDFKILSESPQSDKDSLLIDMLALAKRDSSIHPKEFEYIMQVCEKLKLETKFVINELGANYLAAKYFLKDLATEANDTLIVKFNNSKNKAQFYKNNRVFIFDEKNLILNKGSFQNGARRIALDNGKTLESNIILENILKATNPN